MPDENIDRAELINNLGDLKQKLLDDAEKIEHYRERLRNDDPVQEILDEFMNDEDFFID